MALFQPKNITPDLKGGVKNGVILIPAGTVTPTNWDISWSVNGNNKMVAYQIDFYKNTAGSTLTGSTGKIDLDTPFSAISTDGTEQRFTATVEWSLIFGTYARTGTMRGKFKITQWWGSGDYDYVEQRSLSVFEVSHEGSVHIIEDSGYGGKRNFLGQYLPPDTTLFFNVPLNWARWQIRDRLGGFLGKVIHDSGKVWNATDLRYSTPMLAPGDYDVVLSAEGANGAEYQDVLEIKVERDSMAEIDNLLTVKCDREHDAMKISMRKTVSAVHGNPNGNISIVENNVVKLLDDTSSLRYVINDYSAAKWSFIWHGKINGAGGTVFRVIMENGDDILVDQGSGRLYFRAGSSTFDMANTIGREYWIIFTTGYFTDGSKDGFQWLVYSTNASGYSNWRVTDYTQSRPKIIDLYGPASIYGFQLGFGTGNNSLSAGMSDNKAESVFLGPSITFPHPTGDGQSFDAAWLPLGEEPSNIVGYLYREEREPFQNPLMVYVGEIYPSLDDGNSTPYILDYAALNNQYYRYVVTVESAGFENIAISESGRFEPCFWNWLLIEARQDAQNKELYEAVQVFRFEGNVRSGSYTNRGTRNIQPTFTPYPAVFRSTQNSRQGTLTGLIGKVTNGVYYDSNETEAALRALSSSRNQLFIRDRRGNLIKIALAGEISMSVNDSTAKQEITVSVPWVETGPTDGISVYESGNDIHLQ